MTKRKDEIGVEEISWRLNLAVKMIDQIIDESDTESAFRFKVAKSHLRHALASIEGDLIRRSIN